MKGKRGSVSQELLLFINNLVIFLTFNYNGGHLYVSDYV